MIWGKFFEQVLLNGGCSFHLLAFAFRFLSQMSLRFVISNSNAVRCATLAVRWGSFCMEQVTHQNFAGASRLLAVNSPMNKRGLLSVIVFLGLCFSLAAQQAFGSPPGHGSALTLAQLRSMTAANNGSILLQPSLFNSLDNPVFGFPFQNRDVFSLATTFNLMGSAPQSFLPFSSAMELPRASVPATSAKDPPDRPFDLRPNYYVTGEVGFLYGRSTGKFGGDYKEGYILGEVGNEKMQISVGAAFEDWNGRVPRWGR